MTGIVEERNAHSLLGPSSFHRRIICAGSANAERGLDDDPSIHAATGTVYHNVIADCLKWGIDPDSFIGRVYTVGRHAITFDESFAVHMRPAIDRILELAEGGALYIETRVDISPYTLPGTFGTADIFIIFLDQRKIIVWDNKYGAGVPVSPRNNTQCSLYALGVWHSIAENLFREFDPAIKPKDITVEIIIDQPRSLIHIVEPESDDEPKEEEEDDAVGGGTWETTMGELLALAPFYRRVSNATLDQNAPRKADPHACFFCKARTKCETHAKYHLDQIGLEFDNMDKMIEHDVALTVAPDPRELSIERRIFIAQNKNFALRFWRECHDSVIDDFVRGEATPGVKVVRGRRGPRMWRDPVEAEATIVPMVGVDKAFTRKLASPTAVEAIVGKEVYASDLKDQVTQSEGKFSLVPDSDKRESVQTLAGSFVDLEESPLI